MGIKRSVRGLVAALALLALLAGPILMTRELLRAYNGVSLRICDTPVPGKKLKSLMRLEDGDLTLTAAWTRGGPVPVTGADAAASAQARPVTASGDIRQICPMTLLSGYFPVEEDFAGCLITSDVAMTLFHSTDPVGARVLLSGKTYSVRGIVSAYEPMVIVRGQDASFENLEFTVPNLSAGAALAEAFLYRHGLSGEYVVVENGMYARMLAGLAWLPVALACLLGALPFLAACRRRGGGGAWAWNLLGAACLLALAALVLKSTFYWPEIYLPTKYSDFAFVRELFMGWRADWKAVTLAVPLPKDIQFFQGARATVCGAVAALLLEIGLYLGVARRARSCRNEKKEETHETDR